eukprot:2294518-Rhodomonas_salina.1
MQLCLSKEKKDSPSGYSNRSLRNKTKNAAVQQPAQLIPQLILPKGDLKLALSPQKNSTCVNTPFSTTRMVTIFLSVLHTCKLCMAYNKAQTRVYNLINMDIVDHLSDVANKVEEDARESGTKIWEALLQHFTLSKKIAKTHIIMDIVHQET